MSRAAARVLSGVIGKAVLDEIHHVLSAGEDAAVGADIIFLPTADADHARIAVNPPP